MLVFVFVLKNDEKNRGKIEQVRGAWMMRTAFHWLESQN